MAGQRRVVSAILFSPRGGSSHAARALSTLLPSEGWDSSLVAGSRRDGDPEEDARVFYSGVNDVMSVDFTDALRAVDPMAPGLALASMHPSFEDRPDSPDRVFASLRRRGVRPASARPGAARSERRRRRSRRPAPAPPDADQRGGRTRRPGRPGRRAPARHRAADAGGDRFRARGHWPHAEAWAERLRAGLDARRASSSPTPAEGRARTSCSTSSRTASPSCPTASMRRASLPSTLTARVRGVVPHAA